MSVKKLIFFPLFILGFASLFGALGCGGSSEPVGASGSGGSQKCTPTGTPVQCYCPNNQTGTQMCQNDGTFTQCTCQAVAGSGGGAGVGGAGTGGTAGTTPPAPICGNGVIEGSEQCDGVQLGGKTCQSQGFVGGTLSCDASTCLLNVSLCEQMDSGQMDGGTNDGG